MPRFPSIQRQVCRAALLTVLVAGRAPAQSPTASAPANVSPAPKSYSGCVQGLPGDKNILVISGETFCAKLTGTFSATDISGHEIELKGVLTPRTPGFPATINVGAVTLIGKNCSETCSLRPPGTRGLGKGGEVPGKEGGTPGETPTTPPPPQR